MLRLAILSISMATVMSGAAISPALGLIADAFPDASTTIIKLILTAPSLMIILFSFLSSYLTTKLPKKTIILIGLIIYMIGGIGPQFFNSIELIITFRLILGVGVGLIMPLSMTLINDFFTGKERTKMMGYNSAFSNVGGIFTMLLAGWLATFGWRIPFNVYFMGLIIFMLIYFFLPKDEVIHNTSKESKGRLPLTVYGYALAMSGVMLAYYSIATNIALYLEQSNFTSTTLAGTVVAFTTIGGMITSLFLVQIEHIFNRYTISVMLFGMALAFLTLSFTYQIPVIMISVCFIGFGQGALFPILILKLLDQVPFEQADRAVAIGTSFTFFGQFISPILLDSITKLIGQETIRMQYTTLFIVVLISATVTTIVIFKNSRQEKVST